MNNLDSEFNQIVDKEIVPGLHTAFAHLIVNVQAIPKEEDRKAVIVMKASQTREKPSQWINSLESYAIGQIGEKK